MSKEVIMKPLRNSYSKSDNFKRLSVLAQILSFLQKNTCRAIEIFDGFSIS